MGYAPRSVCWEHLLRELEWRDPPSHRELDWFWKDRSPNCAVANEAAEEVLRALSDRGYALGITAVQAVLGQLPASAAVLVALVAGLFSPAVTGGWTAQLPRVVTGRELDRGSALDALTYTAASLAGPPRRKA